MSDLSEIGELGLIQGLARLFGPGGQVSQGIGDDCAVIESGAAQGEALVMTTDALVEGVHFLSGVAPEHLATKLFHVNASDIAAMGARATWALMTACLPAGLDLGWWRAFETELAGIFSARLLTLAGGDTTASPGPVMVSLALAGRAKKDKILYRHGARAGDVVFVSRPLGAALAGLEMLKSGRSLSGAQAAALIRAQEAPQAEEALGPWLAETGLVTAMTDISDGLGRDLDHLAQASGLGAVVEAGLAPLAPGVAAWAGQGGRPPLDYALFGGEDYALLFTAPPAWAGELAHRARAELGRALFPVGRMRAEMGLALEVEGKTRPLKVRSFEHFDPQR